MTRHQQRTLAREAILHRLDGLSIEDVYAVSPSDTMQPDALDILEEARRARVVIELTFEDAKDVADTIHAALLNKVK
jgi:hypothetical protein